MSDAKIALLHPEELLDKEARGDLTDVERERLEVHLERCEVCRFEREVRADFASDFAGENDAEEQANAERLLALAFGDKGRPSQPHPPVEEVEEPKPASPRISDRPARRKRRAMRALLLVAAALFVGGAATAAGGGSPRAVWATLSAVWSSPPAPAPTVIDAPKPHERAAASSTPVVWASATAIATMEPPPPPPDSTTTKTPTVAVSFAPPPPPPVTESAATLFEAANEARRQGDYARALTLHRQLQAKHPSSREAHASHATVGRLLLDRGDAAGALMSFDAYQTRGSGPLDEAVLVGRATALERLGRTDEARKAWRTLLTTFPETPYADHARARSQ
jgi:TolA-binding protein